MTITPFLKQILIYPIKSFDGISINHGEILSSGAIKYDRQYAICNEKGQFVNGKRNSKIHQLRSTFTLDLKQLTLQIQGSEVKSSFQLKEGQKDLEQWLSDYFGFSVHLIENQITGFPDDLNANGPTVISTATLENIAAWFPSLTVAEIRRRLRTNLEIDGVPSFWEDQLFSATDQPIQFQIGDVVLQGINPCQRCIVPTRDSFTGEATTNFQQIFSQKRQEYLPAWTSLNRFNHFYKVSVNTRISASETGKKLHLDDGLLMI